MELPQITWVEHVEVDERGVHSLYKQLVNSGHAFGAKRWVATLDRQCERLASSMATNIPTGDVGGNSSTNLINSLIKCLPNNSMHFVQFFFFLFFALTLLLLIC